MTVEWADPSPVTEGRAWSLFTPDVLDELRANPGKWACIRRGGNAAGAASRYSRLHPEIETTTRRSATGDGRDVYARYRAIYASELP